MTKSLGIPLPLKEVEVEEFSWTVDRYHQAIDLGFLTENDNVELLFGKLIKKMSIGTPHAACVAKIKFMLNRRFLGELEIRSENPVTLSDQSEPEPDITVAVFREDFYANRHPEPGDIHLVIEVAASTLYVDRAIKSTAYAQADIQEYWIINLRDRQLELYLKPRKEEGIFSSVNFYSEKASFVSPFLGEIEVADLLP